MIVPTSQLFPSHEKDHRAMTLRARLIMPWQVAGMAIMALVFMGSPARAGQITGIVSFGDSLSDVGNTLKAGGIPPSPPYAHGR
jgi:hypothetical protein